MSRDIGQELLDAMHEAIEHARGEIDLQEHEVEDIDVRALRKRLKMSQSEFAIFCGVNVHTLRNWEQGRRHPEGPARVLLLVVDREPEAVLRAVHT